MDVGTLRERKFPLPVEERLDVGGCVSLLNARLGLVPKMLESDETGLDGVFQDHLISTPAMRDASDDAVTEAELEDPDCWPLYAPLVRQEV